MARSKASRCAYGFSEIVVSWIIVPTPRVGTQFWTLCVRF
ncbi:hypothetical protein KPSA3_06605 [Pseudomonas syringae pv. actinidiae]|uniref:Uncharacterized protein n=1 Tax=Pseudomonas syringae pv. actinidiae TaxID=103796 RepID=A0AAN4QBE4_PSESF|nr:hypothetical protein KPSA3_06605 [Pseudomonas syringae pv. actinidiae]